MSFIFEFNFGGIFKLFSLILIENSKNRINFLYSRKKEESNSVEVFEVEVEVEKEDKDGEEVEDKDGEEGKENNGDFNML